ERCPLPDRSVSLSAVAYAGSRLSSVHRGTARRDVMTVTQLLDVDNMARWIQRDGVENILAGLSRYLESDLRRWQDFEKIPRLASHTDFGVSELMPTSDAELFSVKYVNGHPLNPARGLQTVTAFGVLADVDNGDPEFVGEVALLTALRAADTSPPHPRPLGPGGAGARPARCPGPCPDRRRLTGGVPGPGFPHRARTGTASGVRHRFARGREGPPQPGTAGHARAYRRIGRRGDRRDG